MNPLREALVFLWEFGRTPSLGKAIVVAMILLIAGLLANAIGFDIEAFVSGSLDRIDRMLEAASPLLEAVGIWLVRLAALAVLFGCALWSWLTLRTVFFRLFPRLRGERMIPETGFAKLGCSLLVALLLGYFAWVGVSL